MLQDDTDIEKKKYWWEKNFQEMLDGFQIRFSEGLELSSMKEIIQNKQDYYSSNDKFNLRDICKRQVEMIGKKLEEFKQKEKDAN